MAVNKNMSILVVDDFKTMTKILENMLRQFGFTQITEASDGQKALAKLKESKFDLILSDWNMQPMTGLELLKAVRGAWRQLLWGLPGTVPRIWAM